MDIAVCGEVLTHLIQAAETLGADADSVPKWRAMLAYSRPGVIEVLPALPPLLAKNSISGMLLRSFAKLDKLVWDMNARTAELTVTSVKKQDVTLIARHGIEAITAPAGVLAAPLQPGRANIDVHLPENKPVTFHLTLGRRKPLDWVNQRA